MQKRLDVTWRRFVAVDVLGTDSRGVYNRGCCDRQLINNIRGRDLPLLHFKTIGAVVGPQKPEALEVVCAPLMAPCDLYHRATSATKQRD
jgi:hypothetical protein